MIGESPFVPGDSVDIRFHVIARGYRNGVDHGKSCTSASASGYDEDAACGKPVAGGITERCGGGHIHVPVVRQIDSSRHGGVHIIGVAVKVPVRTIRHVQCVAIDPHGFPPLPSPCQFANRNVPVNSPVWSSADRVNDMLPPDPSEIVLSIVTTVMGRARVEEFVRTEEPAGTGVSSAASLSNRTSVRTLGRSVAGFPDPDDPRIDTVEADRAPAW